MEKTSKQAGIKLSALILVVMIAIAVFTALRQQTQTIEYPQAIASFEELQVKVFTLDLNDGTLNILLTDDTSKQCQVPDIELFLSQINGENSLIEAYNKTNPDAPMVFKYLPKKSAA